MNTEDFENFIAILYFDSAWTTPTVWLPAPDHWSNVAHLALFAI